MDVIKLLMTLARQAGWRLLLMAAVIYGAPYALAQSAPSAAPPYMTAYHEYKDAAAKGDLPAANAAAEKAWRGAESSGANRDALAALAFNFALTAVQSENKLRAIEPAQRTLDLSEAGAKGVDVDVARLVLGEALLSRKYEEGRNVLLPVLDQPRVRKGEIATDAYPAAHALALAAGQARDLKTALLAYQAAFNNANGDAMTILEQRGEALIGRGAAHLAGRELVDALNAFGLALQLYAPVAAERADDTTTLGEVRYAQALAWRAAALSLIKSSNLIPPTLEPLAERAALANKPPLCELKVKATNLRYPANEENALHVGAAVMRLSTDEAGKVTASKVLASIPSDAFGKALTASDWTLTRDPTSAPGCRVASYDRLVPVSFQIDPDPLLPQFPGSRIPGRKAPAK